MVALGEGGFSHAPPNNSLDRSANQLAFHLTTWMIGSLSPRPVNSGVMPLR
jgi:hypothetical protein